jgi:hypothetical protein
MTKDEAVKVAGILQTADGGCSHCAFKLAETMQENFPEFDWKNLVKSSPAIWSKDED